MSTRPFTLLDNGSPSAVVAHIDGDRVRLPAAELAGCLGWELKPEGLCRQGTCLPVSPDSGLVDDNGVDLAQLCTLLGRPLTIDSAHNAASVGEAVAVQAQRMQALQAPDFTLPDLDGRPHSLRDYRGKKILLVTHASW